jgi:hypothetical protein
VIYSHNLTDSPTGDAETNEPTPRAITGIVRRDSTKSSNCTRNFKRAYLFPSKSENGRSYVPKLVTCGNKRQQNRQFKGRAREGSAPAKWRKFAPKLSPIAAAVAMMNGSSTRRRVLATTSFFSCSYSASSSCTKKRSLG